jgi:hypothetical protein
MNNSFNGSRATEQLQTTQPGKTVPHSEYLELGTIKTSVLKLEHAHITVEWSQHCIHRKSGLMI